MLQAQDKQQQINLAKLKDSNRCKYKTLDKKQKKRKKRFLD